RYAARPRHRGTFRFGDIHLRLRGPLDLVERQGRVAADAPANVYPDLQEIRRYEVSLRRGLAYDAGQRRARIPGAGSVFERLREYEPDDDPRSISWTATARRGRPISVEYETERQQRIVVAIDSGRMMAGTLGEPTKLVLCCDLADPRLAELAHDAPASTAALYERTVAQTVLEDRARVLAVLRQRGIHTIDVPSDRLTVAVIQRYLELKKRFL